MTIQAELDCDDVVRSFPGAPVPHVQVFSHIKPEIRGIPDRRYYVRGVALFWEVKVGDDRLTKEQFEFLEREYRAGAIAGVGDAEALRKLVFGPLPSTWREIGWQLVLAYKARGFRKAAA